MSTVSCVIAVKNGAKTLKRTIDSLLDQTQPLKQIIIVNDASTDETADIIREYTLKSYEYNDIFPEFVPIINTVNKWLFKSRNIGAKEVTSDYFFFLDADDHVDCNYTLIMSEVLDDNIQKTFAYCKPIYFDNNNNETVYDVPKFDHKRLFQHNYINYSSLIRTSAWKEINGYSLYLNDTWNHLGEQESWIKLGAFNNFNGGIKVNKELFFYNTKEESLHNSWKRNRQDQLYQMLWNFTTVSPPQIDREDDEKVILFVCKAKDSLDKSKPSFSIYTWGKSLEEHGQVFSFYIDIETIHFGHHTMINRLKSMIKNISPDYLFFPTYKYEISVDEWKAISKKVITIGWGSDDSWRFSDYSSKMCWGFTYWITTYSDKVKEFNKIGYNNVICSQWASSPFYFYGDPEYEREIDVFFSGQCYGNRLQVLNEVIKALPDKKIEIYGNGFPHDNKNYFPMLDFPEMCKKMRNAKISINFLEGAKGESQIKLRLFEICSSGCFCMQEDSIDENFGLCNYFTTKEIGTWVKVEELITFINYYLENPEKRIEIAKAGYERTTKDHLWKNRFTEIFNIIENNKSKVLLNPENNVVEVQVKEDKEVKVTNILKTNTWMDNITFSNKEENKSQSFKHEEENQPQILKVCACDEFPCTCDNTCENKKQTIIDNNFYERHKKYQVCYNKIAYLMLKYFDFESYLDIGCGAGFIIEYFSNHEKFQNKKTTALLGIEPNTSLKKSCSTSDLITYIPIQKMTDVHVGELVACMEVFEHIDKQYEDEIVKKVANATKKWLWFTAAVPGQGSHPDEPHINCQPLSYWTDCFEEYGLEPMHELTYQIKQEMLQHPDLSQSYFWFRDNLVIFKRILELKEYTYCSYCGDKKAYIHREGFPFLLMKCKKCKRMWSVQKGLEGGLK